MAYFVVKWFIIALEVWAYLTAKMKSRHSTVYVMIRRHACKTLSGLLFPTMPASSYHHGLFAMQCEGSTAVPFCIISLLVDKKFQAEGIISFFADSWKYIVPHSAFCKTRRRFYRFCSSGMVWRLAAALWLYSIGYTEVWHTFFLCLHDCGSAAEWCWKHDVSWPKYLETLAKQ